MKKQSTTPGKTQRSWWITSVVLGLGVVSPTQANTNYDGVDSYYLGPASCAANPACAHLVGDCCPTSPYGTHLDCCYETDVPTDVEGPYYIATSVPYEELPPYVPEYQDSPPPYSGFLGGTSSGVAGAACGLHPGCAGLQHDDPNYGGDCCPSPTGYDLYCCYAPPPIEKTGYEREFTLYGHSDLHQNYAHYLTSTGQHYEQVDAKGWYVEYERDVKMQYDMIYYTLDDKKNNGVITDAYDYVTGKKKFYITIDATSAPACTQIYLQLDSLPKAEPYNYPIGRHSRYLATYSPDDVSKKDGSVVLEFDYLDSPDQDLSDYEVNAIALFFDPGAFTQNHWVWHSLDSYTACAGGEYCWPSPLKRCQAIYVNSGACGPDDCDNPKCLTQTEQCSKGYATSFLALEDRSSTVVSTATSSTGQTVVRALLSTVLLISVAGAFM